MIRRGCLMYAPVQPLIVDALSRVLIVAPHPDDEALGCGGLIRHALAVGAAIRVLFVTDGDNNPWPQRVVERRLFITPARRTAWGKRRRAEATESVRKLGLAVDDATFLGMADQGLTDDLHDPASRFTAGLAREISAFEPTKIICPSLKDRHRDHSAIALMVRLQAGHRELYEYAIHGAPAADESTRLIHLNGDDQRIKRSAIGCHRSQMALSGKRFLAYARPTEAFTAVSWQSRVDHPIQSLTNDADGWTLALRPRTGLARIARPHVDFLGSRGETIVARRRVFIGRSGGLRLGNPTIADLTTGQHVGTARWLSPTQLQLPSDIFPMCDVIYAKRELSLGFFDEAGWTVACCSMVGDIETPVSPVLHSSVPLTASNRVMPPRISR